MKISSGDKEWIIEGGSVRLRILKGAKAWGMDIEVKSGKAWKLVAGSERNTPRLSGESLINAAEIDDGRGARVFELAPVSVKESQQGAEVLLSGRCGRHEVAQTITVFDGEARIHVGVECCLRGRAHVASLGSGLVFLPGGALLARYEKPEYMWIPALRKVPEHVVADQIFRAPAAIVQHGGYSLAIVPDLDVLAVNRLVPACLDLQLEHSLIDAPWLWYGFKTYQLDGHVYFRHNPEKSVAFKDGVLKYAFDILVSADAPEKSAHRHVLRFLWKRYGAPLMERVEPQAAPFDVYHAHACNYAFKTGGLYHEFEIGGVPVGGTVSWSFTSKNPPKMMGKAALRASLAASRLLPFFHGFATDSLLRNPAANDALEAVIHAHAPDVQPLIMFQAWFNNLRTAYGIHAHGVKAGDEDIVRRARKIKELALCSPVRNGMWSSQCYYPEGEVFWREGSMAFESSRYYCIPDNSWTGVWMLNWFEDIERDERLLDRAAGLGGALIKAQLEGGAIPPWIKFRVDAIVSKSTLRRSAQTAMPGMFLARLAMATGQDKYLASARGAADFIIENVLPDNKWWDFETFFSCSKKDKDMLDAGAGLHCMNNLCIYWSAELMRLLYVATGEDKYLGAGLRIVDTLCLWQQVWDAPYVSINTFGGFGVMNTDGEWNDARQSMFAECLMAWYDATGEREYFERGIAALRASFTTMLCPENRAVAPGNLGRLRPSYYGATYENYAHMGYDRRAPGYSMFDWGSGGAMTAVARARAKYGDIFIDAKAGTAFGIDFCTVTGVSISEGKIKLKLEAGNDGEERSLIVKTRSLKAGSYELKINNKTHGKYTKSALEKGVEVTLNS